MLILHRNHLHQPSSLLDLSTRLKSQQAPKSVTYKEEKNYLSLLIYHDRTCVRMDIKGVE